MTSLTRLSLANRLIVGMADDGHRGLRVLATTSLRQELLPSTQVPTAIVTATYPGASPEIVADEVATPLEQAISGVSGVTKVRATSTNGVASLTVEWDLRAGQRRGDQRHPERRSTASPTYLLEVETEVLAGSTDDIPVLVLGVASDAPLDELAGRSTTSRCRSCPGWRAYARCRWPGRTSPSWRSPCGRPSCASTTSPRPRSPRRCRLRPRSCRPATATTGTSSWPSRSARTTDRRQAGRRAGRSRRRTGR